MSSEPGGETAGIHWEVEAVGIDAVTLRLGDGGSETTSVTVDREGAKDIGRNLFEVGMELEEIEAKIEELAATRDDLPDDPEELFDQFEGVLKDGE